MGIGLKPAYISMITPSRWFTGGAGLKDFRAGWLNDEHIEKLVHFSSATKVFPGTNIAGGVSYFIWNSNKHSHLVEYLNIDESDTPVIRELNKFDVFIADNVCDSIVQKVTSRVCMDSIFGSQSYGLPTDWRGLNGRYKVITSKGIFYCSESDISNIPIGWRVIVNNVKSGKAGEADKNGQYQVVSPTQIADPDTVSVGHYIPVGKFGSREEAERCSKYFGTKFLRVLVNMRAIGISITSDAYKFVPLQDFTSNSDIDWSRSIADIDQQLYRKYNLTPEEIAYIEKTIKPME